MAGSVDQSMRGDCPNFASNGLGMPLQGWGHRIDCGDVEKAFASGECDHVLEGEVKMGGQEHFYLEPQGSVIIPLENDEMVVIASTQVTPLNKRA